MEQTEHPIPNNDLSLMVRAGGGEAELDLLGSSAALNADELTSVLRAMKQVIVTLSEDPAAGDRPPSRRTASTAWSAGTGPWA